MGNNGDRGETPKAVHKQVVVLLTVCLLLTVLLVDVWRHAAPPSPEGGTRDEVQETEAVAQSVQGTGGVWDSHPDADVARVLAPGLVDARQQGYRETPIDSNRFGMRERNYAVPKPPGTIRVVLLGDSYVFGQGVRAEERLGVHLEQELRERAGARGQQVEVIHIGAASWNLVTECAYLRRQLSLLAPDLVIHFSVPNDLDDTCGVRGMGITARSVPRRPGQADVVVRQLFAHWELAKGAFGHLALGIDDESRSRLDEAGSDIARLASLVEHQGGRYVHVFHWRMLNPVAFQHLASRLAAEQVAWLPTSFYFDERIRLSESDDHWSPGGHQTVARYLFGLVESRQLLPAVELSPWEEARWTFVGLHDGARDAAADPQALHDWQHKPRLSSTFDVTAITQGTAAQVHAGIDADGLVGPYASLVLAREEGDQLQLTGAFLDRPELEGGTVAVSVDGFPLGTFELQASGRLDRSWPLPSEVLDRRAVTVRFESDDWVYTLPTLRDCRCFTLERVSIIGTGTGTGTGAALSRPTVGR